MSRIHVRMPDPQLDVAFGWDRPMQTYFAHVLREAPPTPCTDPNCALRVWQESEGIGDANHTRNECQDPHEEVMEGNRRGEHTDIGSLRVAMGIWGRLLDDEIAERLELHRRNDLGNHIEEADRRV